MADSRQRRRLKRLLARPRGATPTERTAPTPPPTKPAETRENKARNNQLPQEKTILRPLKRFLKTCAPVLGPLTVFFSFFPHLTLSEPVTMDSTQFFSKAMTITNDGVLPVFRVWCGIAIRRVFTNSNVQVISADEDVGTKFRHLTCYAGMLSPGDGYTFALENVMGLATSEVKEADLSVIVSYVPILPPVRMDKCTHFVLHQDTSGQKHWFRSPGHCDRFPWFHPFTAP